MRLKFKSNLFFLVVFLLLTSVFYSNFFGQLDGSFKYFQRDSESLILGRLALSEREGVFYQSGLPGCYGDYLTDQYNIYQNTIEVDSNFFNTYNSQIGGQGIFFSILSKVSPFTNTTNLIAFYILTAALLAAVFSLFLVWVKNNFGYFTAIVTLLLMLSSYWIVIFGKNLWWSLWSFYIPFVSLLFFLNREKFKQRISTCYNVQIFCVSFILMFVKCFFTGYEYITTTLIMGVVPYLYYAIVDRWPIIVFVKRVFAASLGLCTGLVMTVFLLMFQLNGKENLEAENGWAYLKATFFRRSYSDSSRFSEPYKESLDSSFWEVLKKYLSGDAFIFKTANYHFAIDFKTVILVLISFSIIFTGLALFRKINNNQKSRGFALMYSLWFSILAPLSWFLIFKSHSYIHTHMNFIVWYMPFMLLGFTWIGYVMSCLYNSVWIKSKQISELD
ncbi:hypothetical protein [Flavobacterium sp. NKUCC04_CG]|uniref:hypothetical protein n=1 Tax=Flavobacterium sp. NKUCC04_CG TaxID=2842121 RepID=UPI001C5A7BA6|nr:hypothetical protein [Flavobacterium sp. NKUCC04_CG]MBW3518026.1 hypothetical protein [Flavobacterium sp. NKUCC04_CG]